MHYNLLHSEGGVLYPRSEQQVRRPHSTATSSSARTLIPQRRLVTALCSCGSERRP